MTDSYRQFSATIAGLTEEQAAWARERLAYLDNHLEELIDVEPDESDKEALRIHQELLEGEYEVGFTNLGFNWTVDKAGENYNVEIVSEEHGNQFHVALFVREYLKNFKPDGFFTMTYADTCSRPMNDGYGGGAIVVTADKIHTLDVFDWITERAEEFLASGKKEC